MPGPTAQDPITLARIWMNEKSPSGRWPDSDLVAFCDYAQKRAVRETLWPPTRFQVAIANNQQTWDDIPLIYETLEIYIAGEIIVPQDVATLEGQQIQYFDASGQGPGPDGDPNSMFTTQWSAQAPANYPVPPGQGGRTSQNSPYSPNQRPVFFWRGAELNTVPPVQNGTTYSSTGQPIQPYMTIFAVKNPCTLAKTTDKLEVGDNFIPALAWLICWQAYFADKNDDVKSLRDDALGYYGEERKWLRSFKWNYQGKQTRGPVVETYRGAYQTGNNRNGYAPFGSYRGW